LAAAAGIDPSGDACKDGRVDHETNAPGLLVPGIGLRAAAALVVTAKEILEEMKPLGRENYKRLLFKNYGVKEPWFGVAIGELTEFAIQIAEKIGPVTADLGNNDCQIPFAPDSIRKVQDRGSIGKKRKTVKC
jgi:hypothetical protein